MTKPKVYYITEAQFAHLVKKKKKENAIFKQLTREFEEAEAADAAEVNGGHMKLNENHSKTNRIMSILRKNITEFPISKALTEALLSTKQVTMDQLKGAGFLDSKKTPETL